MRSVGPGTLPRRDVSGSRFNVVPAAFIPPLFRALLRALAEHGPELDGAAPPALTAPGHQGDASELTLR